MWFLREEERLSILTLKLSKALGSYFLIKPIINLSFLENQISQGGWFGLKQLPWLPP
jgi:hypothetical protein